MKSFLVNTIRPYLKKNIALRKLIAWYVAPSGLFDNYLLSVPLSPVWETRIQDVLRCRDNKHIPRIPDAGRVKFGKQTMHNGLKIHLGSYYGPEIAQMLAKNGGVHEPQEERVFQEVVTTLKPGSVMIELGSFWSFYSMWFQSTVADAQNFMVEPEEFNLGCGKRNFRLNGMKGDFTHAFVGRQNKTIDGVRTICVDDFVEEKGIDTVHMLHSDIQGFEYEMLQGAEKTIDANKVDYLFVSTHTPEVHRDCLNFLRSKKFFIIAESTLEDSFSSDGLIAAHAPHVDWNREVKIALRTKTGSLAGEQD